MDELHHECGVAALYYLPRPRRPLARLDRRPRTRSPGSCRGCSSTCRTAASSPPGMATLQPRPRQARRHVQGNRHGHRGVPDQPAGQVRRRSWRTTPGRAAIGHTRYATCGATSRSYAQPFERRHGCKWKWFAFAFNGQLTNFAELREQLLAQPRLPPDAGQRHRSHHALHRPRACGATTGRTWSRCSATSRRSSTARTTSSS